MSTGSAALSKLTLNPPKFLLLTMPLPPLPEQQRLVARIEELAAQIHEARTLREPARQEANALLNSALRTLASEIEPTGNLGDVLVRPPRNGWSAKCDNADGGTPVLSLATVTGFRYRSSEFKRTSLAAPYQGHFWLRAGDLLITRSNTPELVGHAAIYDGNPSPCIYPDLMMRLELRNKDVERRFVWYWLQSPVVREFISRNAKGTSPTMKKVSQGVVVAVPFPSSLPIGEQRRIVDALDALQAEADALKRLQAETAGDLDALVPAVLDRAFNGEL
jgi:type I restriction enzyme S subunit